MKIATDIRPGNNNSTKHQKQKKKTKKQNKTKTKKKKTFYAILQTKYTLKTRFCMVYIPCFTGCLRDALGMMFCVCVSQLVFIGECAYFSCRVVCVSNSKFVPLSLFLAKEEYISIGICHNSQILKSVVLFVEK